MNFLIPFINIIYIVLDLYGYVLIASVILSWLVAFNVINTHNRFVYAVGDAVYRLTEPVLRPIRAVLPNLGGLDLSPLVAFLGIIFLKMMLGQIALSLGGY